MSGAAAPRVRGRTPGFSFAEAVPLIAAPPFFSPRPFFSLWARKARRASPRVSFVLREQFSLFDESPVSAGRRSRLYTTLMDTTTMPRPILGCRGFGSIGRVAVLLVCHASSFFNWDSPKHKPLLRCLC